MANLSYDLGKDWKSLLAAEEDSPAGQGVVVGSHSQITTALTQGQSDRG